MSSYGTAADCGQRESGPRQSGTTNSLAGTTALGADSAGNCSIAGSYVLGVYPAGSPRLPASRGCHPWMDRETTGHHPTSFARGVPAGYSRGSGGVDLRLQASDRFDGCSASTTSLVNRASTATGTRIKGGTRRHCCATCCTTQCSSHDTRSERFRFGICGSRWRTLT